MVYIPLLQIPLLPRRVLSLPLQIPPLTLQYIKYKSLGY